MAKLQRAVRGNAAVPTGSYQIAAEDRDIEPRSSGITAMAKP
jgi:hypothetical protein